jgi:hypothetical protein
LSDCRAHCSNGSETGLMGLNDIEMALNNHKGRSAERPLGRQVHVEEDFALMEYVAFGRVLVFRLNSRIERTGSEAHRPASLILNRDRNAFRERPFGAIPSWNSAAVPSAMPRSRRKLRRTSGCAGEIAHSRAFASRLACTA